MSFFSKIKRSLGFGGDDCDDCDDALLADSDVDTQSDDGTAAQETQTAADSEPQHIEVAFDSSVQQAMLRGIVEYINSQLPDFISRTTDREAQQNMLYEILDSDIKAYIESVESTAKAYCEARWTTQKKSMAAEMEAIKQRAGELEKHSHDVKQKQLSADRQRRALTDRVHDLESHVARLESEREQFELENRSLVNRVKASNVMQEDLDKLRAENTELKGKVEQFTESPDAAVAERMDILKSEIEALKEQLAKKDAEATEMTDGIESLKEQIRVADEMRDDMRKRLSEADFRIKHAAKDAELVKKKADEEIVAVKSEIEIKDLRIAELEKLVDGYSEVAARMAEADAVMTRFDETIKKQKATIADKDAEIQRLQNAIAENIDSHHERERKLKEEIQALRPPTVVAEMQVNFEPVTEEAAPRISEDEISAIEETFESGEWFTKTAPAETPSMRTPDSESDFGYHAPRRKSNHTHNPDQLSLF